LQVFIILSVSIGVIFALTGGIEAEKLSPPDSLIYACSPLPVEFKIWFIDDTVKILWINSPINSTGDYGYSTLRDTLAGRGFQNDEANLSSVTLTDSICALYDIIVFGFNIPRGLSGTEQTALQNFVNSGGGLFVIAEIATNIAMHETITSFFGITYDGDSDFPYTLSLDPHPITSGVSYIEGNGIMKINTSLPAACIGNFTILFTTYCGLAVYDAGAGRVCSVFDELLFINSYPWPAILDGIDDPEHLQFARNLFDWLARNELRHLDTASIRVSVNGVTIDLGDPRLTYADSILTFAPLPDWLEIETVTVCLDSVSDALGNTLDSSLCTYFIIDREAPQIIDMIPWPGSVVEDMLFPVVVTIVETFCDTLVLSVVANGRFFTPDSSGCSFTPLSDTSGLLIVDPVGFGGHWEEGIVNVCVQAEDICPDTCGPNVSDTCWEFIVGTCREAMVWLECPIHCRSFFSCSTQAIIFGIIDTSDAQIDTMQVFFTGMVFHPGGDIDTMLIQEPSGALSFAGDTIELDSLMATIISTWADGDSVVITFDSLFNNAGCRTIPTD